VLLLAGVVSMLLAAIDAGILRSASCSSWGLGGILGRGDHWLIGSYVGIV